LDICETQARFDCGSTTAVIESREKLTDEVTAILNNFRPIQFDWTMRDCRHEARLKVG
jgi:hypothetical protein